jgi:hypothetical protein
MHVGGHGDPVKMAAAIHEALAASTTPLAAPAAAAAPPPAIDLDTAQLDQIIGVTGNANGGVYQFGVPRRDPITESGVTLAPVGPLGLRASINEHELARRCFMSNLEQVLDARIAQKRLGF